jgi:hypothetical protein
MPVVNIERNQEMARTRLILLGLCAALFGVMAFGASGTQAAKWLILTSGGVVKTGEELKVSLSTEPDKIIVLHSGLLSILFLGTCNKAELLGTSLEGEGKLTSGGKVKFTGCTVETNGSPNANCTPKSNGQPEGTVLTNAGKGQLVLNEGEGLIKVEPVSGAFVTLEMKETCPAGEKLPINGVLYLKDCLKKLETHLVEHLIEEAPLPSDIYITNTKNHEHQAFLLGSLWAESASGHAGLSWSGMPE